MQEVYNSKLKEFDAKVDNEKVSAIVMERQEQLVKDEAFKDVNKPRTVRSKEMMYWESGGKYFALVELVVLIIVAIYTRRKQGRF